MDYIIISTSKCEYQAWQLKLLNWSRKKVKQKGKLLLLVSEDKEHKSEKPNFNFGAEVEVINLPDWATQWKEENDDWWGGIPNKYESFNWIAEQYPFKDEDVLLFLDPDMLFVEVIEYRPKINQIIGQRWIDYRSLNGWEKFEKGFMYPYVLRFDTLKKIRADFKALCPKVRAEFKKWESDMWGLDYAAKFNKVEIEYLLNFGNCTIWQTNGDKTISSIIHYPNIVESTTKEKIFFKQDYTYNQDQEINISNARNAIDQVLLLNVSQERTDYYYHLKWDFSSIFKFYTGKKGFIFLKPWPGGFNNIRMSLELAVGIAFLTDRTLVLPPTYGMYLLKGKSNLSDFFDIDRLGVEVLDFEIFCRLQKIEPTEDAVRKKSKILNYNCVEQVMNFEKIPVPHKFRKWRKALNSEDYFEDAEIIFLDKNLLGSVDQTLYSSYRTELKKLVAKHVVYRNDIFDLAWRFINFIGDKTYYAIHIRRNDFQYKELFISAEELLDNIAAVIPAGVRLYIATDHREKDFFKPFQEKYEVIFYQEIAEKLELEPFNVNWIPIIEQFVCTRSIKFVGMKLSTLSSYVFRMRGYMNDIEDKQYYINTEKYSETRQCHFEEDNQYIANWSREYKSSWSFNDGRIFVSIAAFCDQQLIPTIENLLDQASNPTKIIIGVHIQDDKENYEKLLSRNFNNLKIIFTPKEEAKGVVWARNRIKRELFANEEYFLQIDSHSRFKQNWDNILICQLNSIEIPKVIITTYPNHFDIGDEEKEYLKLKYNTPLKIKSYLTDDPTDNRLKPENLDSLKNYEVKTTKWCAAGFLFARGEWVKEVSYPDEIKFNGEEDLMTIISYRKGYNFRVPSEATVWHNYNFKNEKTGERYKEFNTNSINDNSLSIVNEYLFQSQTGYVRSLEELEEFLDFKFRKIEKEQETINTEKKGEDLTMKEQIKNIPSLLNGIKEGDSFKEPPSLDALLTSNSTDSEKEKIGMNGEKPIDNSEKVNNFALNGNTLIPIEKTNNNVNQNPSPMQLEKNESTIFVAIASYLDKELRDTILDCINKANNPECLHFGVCLQWDKNKGTEEHCIDDLIEKYTISIDKYFYKASDGVGWAHNKAQQLYNGETYFLQIDAHTRFISNWDDLIIKDYKKLKTIAEKPLISFLPPGYKKSEEDNYHFKYENELDKINIPQITAITEEYCFEYIGHNEQNTGFQNIKVPVLDGCFIFTHGEWANEIFQDPEHYYMGEEVALSLRAFTVGYDFFTPSQILAWHGTQRLGRRKHYEDQVVEIVKIKHGMSMLRLKALIEGKDLGKYGLGRVRNLEDYRTFSGVNFVNNQIENTQLV